MKCIANGGETLFAAQALRTGRRSEINLVAAGDYVRDPTVGWPTFFSNLSSCFYQEHVCARAGFTGTVLCLESRPMNTAMPAKLVAHPIRRHRRLPDRLEALGTAKRYSRDQEICSQAHPIESWCRVTVGAARKSILLSSGRRQILDLLLAGDFFDDIEQPEHDFVVEAVTEGTMVIRYPHRPVQRMAESDPELLLEIRRIGLEILARLEELVLILGRTTAREKVGCFLLLMSQRSAIVHGDAVALPISRYDIADYLGLSVETVSRSLTDLRHRGLIVLAGTREVRIINAAAIADGDYRPAVHNTMRSFASSVPCHSPR